MAENPTVPADISAKRVKLNPAEAQMWPSDDWKALRTVRAGRGREECGYTKLREDV